MRNWNRTIGGVTTTPPYRFEAYLWGIETTIGRIFWRICVWVWSLPMRNWNPVFSSWILHGLAVWSLPMRNWNWRRLDEMIDLTGFEAYLWGIETMLLHLDTLHKNSLKPTYEELKLNHGSGNNGWIPCLKPTYEELKHRWFQWFRFWYWWFEAYLWGIETWKYDCGKNILEGLKPTYEELKLGIAVLTTT